MKLYAIIVVCLLCSSCSQNEEAELTTTHSIQIESEDQEKITLIEVPDIIDLSEKGALLKLQSHGFHCLIEYVPDQFTGPTVGMAYQGKFIKAGTKIPEGDTILIYVGVGNDLGQELLYDQYLEFMQTSDI